MSCVIALSKNMLQTFLLFHTGCQVTSWHLFSQHRIYEYFQFWKGMRTRASHATDTDADYIWFLDAEEYKHLWYLWAYMQTDINRFREDSGVIGNESIEKEVTQWEISHLQICLKYILQTYLGFKCILL